MKLDKKLESKVSSFIGKALIYDEEIFINTSTGEGIEKVVKKMDSYIGWLSKKIRLSGFDKEDVKQFIIMTAIDGIRRYKTDFNVKLSTFLYVHIRNKIITKIRRDMRKSANPTFLEPFFRFTCQCGSSFISKIDEGLKSKCIGCHREVDKKWTVYVEHHETECFDSFTSFKDKNEHTKYNKFYNFMNQYDECDEIQQVENKIDLNNILRHEDFMTRRIVEAVYLEDASVSDAARELGISSWNASIKLKKIRNKKRFIQHFLAK